MVLPVMIGALAAGAGAAALKPHYDNYVDRVRGGANRRALEGVDPNDPAATDRALFGAGKIAGDRFSANLNARRESELDRASAELRSRIATGPAWARIGLEMDALAIEQQRAAEAQEYNQWVIDTHGTEAERAVVGNPFTPPQVRQTVAGGILARETAPPLSQSEVLARQAADAGNRVAIMEAGEATLDANMRSRIVEEWRGLMGDYNPLPVDDAGNVDYQAAARAVGFQAPKAGPVFDISDDKRLQLFSDLQSTGGALDALSDAIAFVRTRSQKFNRGDRRQLEERLLSTVAPALQTMANAGTLDQGEFERLAKRLDINTWGDAAPLDRLTAINKELTSLYEKNAAMFENATTEEQRSGLGYERRGGVASGQSKLPAGAQPGAGR